MSGHASHRTHCQNCGTGLSGPYCFRCGQHDVDYNRSFGHILEDSLEGALHLDGKFFRSVQYLFTRPGFLTKEFIAGRRTRYTHPVRFYIFASFLFFAIGALEKDKSKPNARAAAKAAADAGAGEAKESAGKRKPEAGKGEAVPPAQAEAGGADDSAGTTKSTWLRHMIHPLSGPLERGALQREIKHLTPTMLFLCMPLLAAVLKLVYSGSGRLYIEHLVFALHIMAFVFLAMLVADAAQALAGLIGDGTESFVGFSLTCLSAWLIYRAFRTVYGQGRMKTLLKMGLVGLTYGAILIVGICAVVIASYEIVSREF